METPKGKPYTFGPDGAKLYRENLPERGFKGRWTLFRKAEVVAGVRGGLLTLEEACANYNLTIEEYVSWGSEVEQRGLLPRGVGTKREEK